MREMSATDFSRAKSTISVLPLTFIVGSTLAARPEAATGASAILSSRREAWGRKDRARSLKGLPRTRQVVEPPAHRDRRHEQAEGEAEPDAEALKAQNEPEEEAGRETREPIASAREDHWHARILHATQSERCHHLQTVEDLEGGRDPQEHGDEHDRFRVLRQARVEIEAGNRVRKDEEHDRTHPHEHDGEHHRRITRAAHA